MEKKPQVPTDIKAFNRDLIQEHRANKGRLSGPRASMHVLLLTTTGMRSGEPRTVVLGYNTDGDRQVVIASGNGAPEHPAWYRNLSANPKVTVELGPEKFTAKARTARPEERDRLKPLVPYIESQQKLTAREIPIVVLERV